MGTQASKHAERLETWSARIAACRSSGMRVREWCESQGISVKAYYYWARQIDATVDRETADAGECQSGALMRVEPDALPCEESSSGMADSPKAGRAASGSALSAFTIHHGESIIEFPEGSQIEAIAEFVKALNRHV